MERPADAAAPHRARRPELSWLQLAFLAAIALLPFSTSLLAEFISFRLALFAYWLNIFAGGAP